MDVSLLAQSITQILIPCLPFLGAVGAKAAEGAATKVGADTWERAKLIWHPLQSKVEARPAALEAVQDVVKAPDSAGARGALAWQLEKILGDDQMLAAEIGRLWQETQPLGITVTASGERSVAVGGSVSGSTIVTGDSHGVEPHR